MRLSEAIRLGALLKPQGREAFIQNGATCAVGAALDACGQLDGYADNVMHAQSVFPLLAWSARPCPACCDVVGWINDVYENVWHLNDDHDWTREQIADWVATLEPKEQSTDVEPEYAPTLADA